MTVTTYHFRTIEAEDYTPAKMSPHQIAQMNSVLYGTPNPDIEERVTDENGQTTVFINQVQIDGTTKRVQL